MKMNQKTKLETKLKKAIALCGAVCIMSITAVGCGSDTEFAGRTEEDQAGGSSQEERSAAPLENSADAASQESTGGKWQVLEPDVAAAVDADLLGKVWKTEEDSFYIVEKKVKILEDGSMAYSSPSSNADIPDSQLIHVIFEEDTRFYTRTAGGSGESYEDREAEFQDLKQYMLVEMKGGFQEDEFHATEVRIAGF